VDATSLSELLTTSEAIRKLQTAEGVSIETRHSKFEIREQISKGQRIRTLVLVGRLLKFCSVDLFVLWRI